jgi:AcrR family transcriptional regulator
MPRWEPDTQHRLETAALHLFAENGYDGTTTAEIAIRAGLEKRSFFRYFPDKREVLFSGTTALTDSLRLSLGRQAATTTPWDAVMNALKLSDEIVAVDQELSRVRRHIIGENAELREREVLKAAQLEDLLCALLTERGAAALPARVTARLALLVYEQAFGAWLDSNPQQPFASYVDQIQQQVTRAVPTSPSVV